MRGPLVGALVLSLALIALSGSQPGQAAVSAAAPKNPAATVPTALVTATPADNATAITAQAKSSAKDSAKGSQFKSIAPIKALRKLQTKAERTVIPHKFRTVPPAKLGPSRPLTVSTAVAPRVTTYNSLNAGGVAAGDTIGVTPPDSTGAIGPNYYVEIVNSEIAVRRRTDLSAVSTAQLVSLSPGLAGAIMCDPQVQWDPNSNRWLVSMIVCNAAAGTGSETIVVGWSKTSDPTNLFGGWCLFTIGTGNELFDYAKLGHNSKYLIIGGNFYIDSNLAFDSAAIAWIGKPANGSTSCATTSLAGTNGLLLNGDGFTPTFTPVPVNTNNGASDGYIFSAYDPAGNVGPVASQRKMAMWHLDSAGVLHAHPDMGIDLYSLPVAASQQGGSWAIETLDGRLTQAVGNPTTGIWMSHTVDDVGLGTIPSVLRWYEFKVSGTTVSRVQEGNVSNPTDWIFNGAISPRQDGLGAMVEYSRSSGSIDPVIAAQVRLSSTPIGSMEPGELLLDSSAGADQDLSCGKNGFPCRWGDYSGLTPDPINTNVVWGSNEILDAPSGTTPKWHDRNFALMYVPSPSTLTARGDDQSAIVSWTPGPADPNTPVTSYTVGVYDGITEIRTVAASPDANSLLITGLSNDTPYTFTIITHVDSGADIESSHSNPATPTRGAAPAGATPTPTRDPSTQSSPIPPPTPR